ncbi:MAG: CDP-alcohol phosphatidyltransferase family protein [Pseudobdellovibrio sp.]
MIDDPFRSRLPRYVGPILSLYKTVGLSPNQVTFIALILGGVSSYLVSQQYFISAATVWWVGRLLDGTDGIYARATKQTTAFGAHFDILADMASYSMMIIGFYFAFPGLQFLWLSILFLYVLCITGALSLGNLEDKQKIPTSNNRGLRLAAGIAEGGETGIAYTLFLLFPVYIKPLAEIWIGVLVITVVARLWLAKDELR